MPELLEVGHGLIAGLLDLEGGVTALPSVVGALAATLHRVGEREGLRHDLVGAREERIGHAVMHDGHEAPRLQRLAERAYEGLAGRATCRVIAQVDHRNALHLVASP